MNIILNVVSSLFDLAILFIYLRHFMEERKKNIPVVLYFGAFVLNELLLYCHLFIPEQWHTQLTLLMSFVLTFALTFLHKGRMRYRFFITFSFQAYASLSEFVVYALFSMMPGYMSDALERSGQWFGMFQDCPVYLPQYHHAFIQKTRPHSVH